MRKVSLNGGDNIDITNIKYKLPTREDLDYVHKLILIAEERKLLDDDTIDDCINLLDHISFCHHLIINGCNENCDKIRLFWIVKEKLEEITRGC